MREEGALFLGEGVLVLHHGLGVGAYWGGGSLFEEIWYKYSMVKMFQGLFLFQFKLESKTSVCLVELMRKI